MNKSKMYNDVITLLKKDPMYQNAEGRLDYTLESYSRVEDLPDDEIKWIHGIVDEGSCEGIFVDLIAETQNQQMRIGTWKTLDTSAAAYIDMGVIAGLSTWAAYKAWRESA